MPSMNESLNKLFGSPARVKLLRLFLFNPRQSYTVADAALRARVPAPDVRKEFRLFESIGLIAKAKRGKGLRYTLLSSYPYVEGLTQLLLNTPGRAGELVRLVRGVGTMKLIILSGIFLDDWDGVIDVLIVGDKIKDRQLKDHIKRLEAEIGKELRFAVLATDDFLYRVNMSDKLLRDVLDYPHKVVLDKLNIGIR